MTVVEGALCAIWVLSNVAVMVSNERFAAIIKENIASNNRVLAALRKGGAA